MLRATLKSLLSRKLRLILSGLAVVLGVMFVSGAFVLTDTLGRSFDQLFAGIYANIDVNVTAAPKIDTDQPGGGDPTATVPAAVLDTIRAIPGVTQATGVVGADGARLIGANGKTVPSSGPPRLGVDWPSQTDQVELRAGHGPTADTEIAINAALATAAGVHLGDSVKVLTITPNKQTFTIVGIFGYPGDKDSLGGTQVIAFTQPTAQHLMLGETGAYSAVHITAADTVTPDTLRERVATTLGANYTVKTGQQLTDETTTAFEQALSFFNKILLGFAGVALFVGIFLILNTFSIIVAQRTREVALLRALGAARRQVIGSVLIEAIVIGLIASVIGLGAGIGIGALLAYAFSHTGGASIDLAGIGVPPAAIIGAFTVGLLVTTVAALLPALRAARIPPVAALRDAATPDRPLTRLTITGAAILATGGTLLALGLTGNAADQELWAILGGVLLTFIGTALLTPLIARPAAALLGQAFAWSVPGRLGRLNAGRNPRRTAITAAALMVGIALITGIYTVFASAKTSITQLADSQIKAEFIISGDAGNNGRPVFDPAVIPAVAALPQVKSIAGLYSDVASVNGHTTYIGAVTDLPALRDMFGLTVAQGSLDTLTDNQITVDADTATTANAHLGDQITIQTAKGEPHTYTISGIYAHSDLLDGWILPATAATGFRVAQPSMAFVMLRPGADTTTAKQQIDTILADNPEVGVADRHEFIDQQAASADQILTMVQILLALAILIAVLGIINTLALSVLERTRELGLLRAVGLRRGQAMRMITVEAVVVTIFGAILGLTVGAALGAATVRALHDEGITNLTLPWGQMLTYLALAAVAGVIASVLPAIRAARVNVLQAISYE